MKKVYLKPEAEMLTLMPTNMLAISGPGYEGGVGNPDDFGSKANRGEWGNIWK